MGRRFDDTVLEDDLICNLLLSFRVGMFVPVFFSVPRNVFYAHQNLNDVPFLIWSSAVFVHFSMYLFYSTLETLFNIVYNYTN